MRPRTSGEALQRSLRKQDLLLASALARGQVMGSFNELAEQADGIVARIDAVRQWLSNPLLWVVGGTAAVAMLAVASRRGKALRMVGAALRWGLLAWRLGGARRAPG